jgi:hypothetical protein
MLPAGELWFVPNITKRLVVSGVVAIVRSLGLKYLRVGGQRELLLLHLWIAEVWG